MKYKANQDFINNKVQEVTRKGKKIPISGNVREGDVFEHKNADDLLQAGYISEYKTKVVHQKPEKPKKTTKKKASKKAD